jgi:integrase/recombinase XerC
LRKEKVNAEWVFASRRKGTKTGHITHTGIEKLFRQVRETAKLPKEPVLYSARHSFATDLLDRTGDIKTVGDVLGHESRTTIQK